MNRILSAYLLQKTTDTNDEMSIKEIAEKWTSGMENEDGTFGAHWCLEETQKVAKEKGIEKHFNEYVWFITMNMMYSDYYKVIKHFELDEIEFCTLMSIAFLDDKDAVSASQKIRNYYCHIVKK